MNNIALICSEKLIKGGKMLERLKMDENLFLKMKIWRQENEILIQIRQFQN